MTPMQAAWWNPASTSLTAKVPCALELIGKHLGMYQDKLKLDAKLDTGQLGKVLEQLGAPDG